MRTLAKELTVSTQVMTGSSNEVITSIDDSVNYKQTKVDTYVLNFAADVDSHTGFGVCYRPH